MLKEVTDVLTICENQANFKDHERYKALCASAALAAQATPPTVSYSQFLLAPQNLGKIC